MPGIYNLEECNPPDYGDTGAFLGGLVGSTNQPGVLFDANNILTITLTAGDQATNYCFGDVQGRIIVRPSKVKWSG